MIQNNIRSVDNAQRPEFLLLCSQRWLNIVLDLLASAIATSVVLIAIVLRGQVSGAQVGIALNIMLVANTTLLKLVENWTTLEISLGAISRVKQLEKTTPTEGGPAKSSEPPQNWPSAGHIVFRDVSASYQYVCVTRVSPATANSIIKIRVRCSTEPEFDRCCGPETCRLRAYWQVSHFVQSKLFTWGLLWILVVRVRCS